MRFTPTEVRHIFISVLVLAVAVSGLGPWSWLGVEKIAVRIASVSIPLAIGFVAHELSHKFVAMRYGYLAVYRMWGFGLLIALLIGIGSNGRMLFAAPGAVVILTPYYTRREGGLIGLAGPLANFAVAACFFPLRYFGGFLATVSYWGTWINVLLAFFNLLPVSPLDGGKVWLWDFKIGIGIILLAGALLFFVS